MKQIHDANPAAFAPQPFGILGFFGPQQIFQLIWLRELFRREDQVERGTLRYVPWYALGNVMIGVWMFIWVRRMTITLPTEQAGRVSMRFHASSPG